MKCLILAAGKGSRLIKRGESKPLIPLLGLTLIERTIVSAKNAGINEFYIVLGYNSYKVKKFLQILSKKRDVQITIIQNDEWQKENGISVLKAYDFLKNENFILLMCDHIFDEATLKKLKEERLKSDEIILAVDYNLKNSNVNINDVTKVYIENSFIKNIGKKISDYNAYDTGMFLCSPAIFKAIKKSIKLHNDSTLSGGVRILAQKNKAKAFDIKNRFWLDIDDENDLKRAEKLLLKKFKEKLTDGPVSRYMNRPVSIFITKKFFLNTNITPNFISFITFLFSVAGALLFLLKSHIFSILGALIIQFSSILDGCDGEVARLKYMESDFGKWFDAVLDRYADAIILFGLSIYLYSINPHFINIIIGFLAIVGSFMNSYTADKYDGLIKSYIGIKKLFRIGRDVRIFIIFIGAILNQVFYTLLLLAIIMNTETIRRIILFYRNEKSN